MSKMGTVLYVELLAGKLAELAGFPGAGAFELFASRNENVDGYTGFEIWLLPLHTSDTTHAQDDFLAECKSVTAIWTDPVDGWLTWYLTGIENGSKP